MNYWWILILVIVSPVLLYILTRILFSGVFRSYFTEKLTHEKERKDAQV
jgi:ABC-type bacteriocin/lantibiotic exporter with double-glycine peptidase domain